jgi:peroxiredoxin
MAVSLATLEGKTVDLARVLADGASRPTLLVFFKVSCPVCQMDWPYLERLHRAHGEGLRVVGVSQNDAAASLKYHAAYGGATFDLLLDPEPAFGASNAYGVASVPHHVLLEPDGTVRRVFAGWQRKPLEELDAELSAAHGRPPAGVVPPGDPAVAMRPG